jgi:WD repeat-containing protein mio
LGHTVGYSLTTKEEGTSYHNLMQFEATQYPEMMGSLLVDDALKNIPLFGDRKDSIAAIAAQVLESANPQDGPQVGLEDEGRLFGPLVETRTAAEKLLVLRNYAQAASDPQKLSGGSKGMSKIGDGLDRTTSTSVGDYPALASNRQAHENLLTMTLNMKELPRKGQAILDHIMLLRSKEKYLFDYSANMNITSDDAWLEDLWRWVSGKSYISPIPQIDVLTYLSRSLGCCLR